MRPIKFILLLQWLFSITLHAQDHSKDFSKNSGVNATKRLEIFDIQKPPSFPGGDPELHKYLQENLIYPINAKLNKTQGVVTVAFIVNTNGEIKDASVIKDIGEGCGQEALRLVNNMPPWVPGESHDQKVKIRYVLSIRFKLP
jgi:TonB family protein